MKKIALLIALLLPLALVAGSKKPSAQVDFTIVKETDGKPIRNASVVLHGVDKSGRQKKDAYEVKTDAEGKTSMSGIDYGTYRIQVLAEHYQTYGADLEISAPQKELTIKLKPPQKQFSTY